MSFTPEQLKWVAIIPKVSGGLSAAGDTYIFYDILSDRKKFKTSYHRIMLGVTIIDFMVSCMFFVSSWAVPADTNPFYGVFQPSGSLQTCNFQGFIIQFGIAAPIYNLSLCFYYYAVIVNGWKEFQVRKLEISMHVFALLVGIVTAIIGLVMKQYNNYMNICWIHGDPFECEFVPEVECRRGEKASLYRLCLYTIPLWSLVILSTVVLGRVFLHVRARETKSRKWRHAEKKKCKNRLTNEVAWQSFWYLLAFFVTWIPATVVGLMELSGIPPTFQALSVTQATMPLQGFLNCLTYIRPTYLRWVKKHPQFSVWRKYKSVYTFSITNVSRLLGSTTESTTGATSVDECEMAWMESERNQSTSAQQDPNVRILYEDFNMEQGCEHEADNENIEQTEQTRDDDTSIHVEQGERLCGYQREQYHDNHSSQNQGKQIQLNAEEMFEDSVNVDSTAPTKKSEDSLYMTAAESTC